MPTTPPFEAEYAIWPTWPSNAAIEAVLTQTPRSPSSSGSFAIIALAAKRSTLNVPIRLIAMIDLERHQRVRALGACDLLRPAGTGAADRDAQPAVCLGGLLDGGLHLILLAHVAG